MTGTDRDILISRVIDGEATPEDWSALKALAERDPSVWRDLAGLQQDHAELSGAIAEAVMTADAVEAPLELMGGIAERGRALRTWGGWAAAAALGLAWIVNGPRAQERVEPMGRANLSPFGLGKDSKPEDFFDAYLQSGRATGKVVGEVGEPVLIETIPQESGGYEVRYLRQVLERRVVPQVYEVSVGYDERGTPVPTMVPARIRSGRM